MYSSTPYHWILYTKSMVYINSVKILCLQFRFGLFFWKIKKSTIKLALSLLNKHKKKVCLKHASLNAPCFRVKKRWSLGALHFVHKHAFTNTASGVFNNYVQGSNPPSPNYWIIIKKYSVLYICASKGVNKRLKWKVIQQTSISESKIWIYGSMALCHIWLSPISTGAHIFKNIWDIVKKYEPALIHA